jgi:hypothetical protein
MNTMKVYFRDSDRVIHTNSVLFHPREASVLIGHEIIPISEIDRIVLVDVVAGQ